MLQGILIVVAFLVVAALMMTKKIPTLLALPLMAVVICIIAGVPMFGKNADGAEIGWLTTVFEAGTVRMGSAIMAVIFGAWLGGGLGAFLILLAEPGKALWFILFLLILQQVEGNLIYPKVVGKSVGLPGLLVLMAVTIGGEAFGILGMLFSVPVCAVLYSLYLEFMKKASARH